MVRRGCGVLRWELRSALFVSTELSAGLPGVDLLDQKQLRARWVNSSTLC